MPPTNVVIALLTGIFALLVAAISLVNTLLASRSSARQALELEALKSAHEKSESRRTLLDAEFLAIFDALKNACSVIQRLKDQIQIVLLSARGSIGWKATLSSASSSRDELFGLYEDIHVRLQMGEVRALHHAKTIGLKVYDLLQTASKSTANPSRIRPKTRKDLEALRAELSDCQQILRESRNDRLCQATLDLSKPRE